MELSKNLSATFNSIFPFGDFLYILQQEEYSSRRYLKWLPRFFFRRNFQVRDHLRHTARSKVIYALASLLWIIAIAFSVVLWKTNIFLNFLAVVLFIMMIPLFLLTANILSTPLFSIARRDVMKKAAAKIAGCKNLRIIAIAGSFGKTTTKNFIYELIRYNHKTQLIPENINTTLGIANWILQNMNQGTGILIVEMDAYKRGEIEESCAITPPDTAIITAIGDQHLERFGKKETLAHALNEVFTHAKSSAQLLCDPDTARQLPSGERKNLILVGRDELTMLAPHLDILSRFSASNLANLAFAIRTAKLLGVSEAFIIDTCKKMELPDRRQKLIVFHGYDCIDDSYNISFTTAQAGIASAKDAALLKKKKLLVVTAGIPELGPDDQDKNMALGALLSSNADCVALLKSMFYQQIAKGISDPKKYILFNDLSEFWKRSEELFPKNDWLLLLQPELTDLYY